MVDFKTIKIKKRGGGTRQQRVKVLPSGKYKFVKNIKSKSKRSRPSPRKARKVKRRMSRKRRSRSRTMTIPLAPMAGLAAGLADPVIAALNGDYPRVALTLVSNYTGYDISQNKWNPAALLKGVAPLVAGLLVHKFIGGPPLNLNKVLANARVPFIRI